MSSNAAPVVELRDAARSFSVGGASFVALAPTTLALPAGKLIAVIGKSGSGKSTLLNLVAGLDRPTSGTVRVAGTTLNDLDESGLSRWRGRQIGVVFQFFQLLPTLTVVENVMLPLDLCRTCAPPEARRRALALLERVGVADQAHKLPTRLSGGQQQRVAIARALANDPPLLVADEPTGNLDSDSTAVVVRLLRELTEAGKSVLLVTHEREIAAGADVVVALKDGRVERVSP